MIAQRMAALGAVAGLACPLAAQSLALRFANGSNQITVAPGTGVPVQLWVVGLPNVGTPMWWTTPPGTGQPSTYVGFASVLTALNASGGTWTPPTAASIAPGFAQPPFGNPGSVSGTNIHGINIGVGFQPSVTGNSFLLWSGTITVGASNVSLATVIQPVGQQQYLGLEVHIHMGLNLPVSHFLPAANGTALITVPAPASLALVGSAGLAAGRRKRESRVRP